MLKNKKLLLKRLFISILFLFTLTGLFASGKQEAEASSEVSSEEISINITDMRGRTVSLPATADKVIALGAGSLRLVSYLDAADKVIAVEDAGHGREKSEYMFSNLATYRLAHPEYKDLPSIGSSENHEGIIAAEPDLIISSAIDVAQLDQLQQVLDIPVFAVDVDVEFYDTDTFYTELEKLGKILGKEERASELVSGIKSAMLDLQARSEKVLDPKNAYAGGMMYYGPADLFRTTGDYIPFDFTGTKNVMPTNPTGNLQPYMTSLEDVIAASPDYVFIDSANINLSKSGFADNKQVLEEEVPAFSEKQVYSTFVYKYYGTNWENQLINVYYVGNILYPDLFSDITVKDKAEEIWNLFFNKSLDYDTVVAKQKGGPGQVDWFN
ncbi:MAG: ABC transporter substrate-binding protein [Spirochaetales bacterium]|nr:ABC transporter substrate-binding protein [Spirochaetales bacterium]